MRGVPFAILLLTVSMVGAIDTVSTQPRFVAALGSTDSSSLIGTTPEFLSWHSASSGSVAAESTVSSVAPFRFNITRFHVMANVANCGDYTVGNSLHVTVRMNEVDTILQGNCTGGAAVNSFTLDLDTVEVLAGARLSIEIESVGTSLARNPRVGFGLQGSSNLTFSFEDDEGTFTETPDVDTLSTGTELDGTSTLNVLLLLAMGALAVWVYTKSGNILGKTLGACFAAIGAVAAATQVSTWYGMLLVFTVLIFLSGYLFFKASVDFMTKRRNRNVVDEDPS